MCFHTKGLSPFLLVTCSVCLGKHMNLLPRVSPLYKRHSNRTPIPQILQIPPVPSIRRLFKAEDYLLVYGTRTIFNAKGQSGYTINVFSTILAEAEKIQEVI